MKQMVKDLMIATCVMLSANTFAQTLHIYGGDNNKVYLGCLNCSDMSSSSIWNELSSYGNSFNSNSIWNEFGTYGSDYGSYSPWNDYASNPPVLVDAQGNFYGYLTANTAKPNRADFKLALILYKYHDSIKDDVSGWYKKIFN